MRRRWLLRVLAAGLLLLVTALAFVLWPPASLTRITRENFDRIEYGMSPAEVEAILGPPGDYRSGPVLIAWPGVRHTGLREEEVVVGTYQRGMESAFDPDSGYSFRWWRADTFVLHVEFSPESEVIYKRGWDAWRVKEGLLDDLLWRLKRHWRRWFP
jgi:hypothetical protein